MDEMKLKLSIIWIVVMMIYFLGDILRIISGDVTPGEIDGQKIGQTAYLGMAALMLIPILMVYFSFVLDQPVNRWANIIVAGLFFLFNLAGLPTYPGHYDKFLLGVSLVFNLLTIWYAWGWT